MSDSDETMCDPMDIKERENSEDSPSILGGLLTRGFPQTREDDREVEAPLSPQFLPPSSKLTKLDVPCEQIREPNELFDSQLTQDVDMIGTQTEEDDVDKVIRQTSEIKEKIKNLGQLKIAGKQVQNTPEFNKIKSLMVSLRLNLTDLNSAQQKGREQLTQDSQEGDLQQTSKDKLRYLAVKQKKILELFQNYKELVTKMKDLKEQHLSALPGVNKYLNVGIKNKTERRDQTTLKSATGSTESNNAVVDTRTQAYHGTRSQLAIPSGRQEHTTCAVNKERSDETLVGSKRIANEGASSHKVPLQDKRTKMAATSVAKQQHHVIQLPINVLRTICNQAGQSHEVHTSQAATKPQLLSFIQRLPQQMNLDKGYSGTSMPRGTAIPGSSPSLTIIPVTANNMAKMSENSNSVVTAVSAKSTSVTTNSGSSTSLSTISGNSIKVATISGKSTSVTTNSGNSTNVAMISGKSTSIAANNINVIPGPQCTGGALQSIVTPQKRPFTWLGSTARGKNPPSTGKVATGNASMPSSSTSASLKATTKGNMVNTLVNKTTPSLTSGETGSTLTPTPLVTNQRLVTSVPAMTNRKTALVFKSTKPSQPSEERSQIELVSGSKRILATNKTDALSNVRDQTLVVTTRSSVNSQPSEVSISANSHARRDLTRTKTLMPPVRSRNNNESVRSMEVEVPNGTGKVMEDAAATVEVPQGDLKMLLYYNVIHPGDNVLSVQLQDKRFEASLRAGGHIQSTGGEIFHTPMAWLKAVTGSKAPMKQTQAYNKISYKNKLLSSFSMPAPDKANITRPATIDGITNTSGNSSAPKPRTDTTLTRTSIAGYPVGKTHRDPARLVTTNADLVQLMRKCRVRKISDNELVPSTNFLPNDFWEMDFDQVDLRSLTMNYL